MRLLRQRGDGVWGDPSQLATEIADWRRFERPTQLAAYLGLVLREDSCGDRERKGSITKAGNRHCRHVWCKRHGAFTTVRRRPSISNGARRGGAAAGGDCARVEGATAISRALHPSRIGKQSRSRWWRWRASSSAFCGQRGKTARRAPNDDSPSNRTNWKTACGLRLEGRALATALCGSRSQQARDPRVWNAVAPTNPLASEASIRSVAVRFNER